MLVTEMFDRFKAAMFQANIQQFAPTGTSYAQFFPQEFSPSLKTEVLSFNTSPNVAGDIVALGSRIGNKGRETPGSIMVDIPKVGIARYKDEKDYANYIQLRAMANSFPAGSQTRSDATNRILQLMYEDGPFAVNGVHSKLEWTAKQIASAGKYKLTADVNAGGVITKQDITFGVPAANFIKAAKVWSDPTTSTPIKDFQNRSKAARAKGYVLGYAIMDLDTFNDFAASVEVQKYCASYISVALNLQQLPDLATVNRALAVQNLPQILIWDTYVTLEKGDGGLEQTTGWSSGQVIFSETATLGTTRYATNVDSQVAAGGTIVANNGFITVKAYATENPILMTTFSAAYATPVLENVTRKFILDTKTAA